MSRSHTTPTPFRMAIGLAILAAFTAPAGAEDTDKRADKRAAVYQFDVTVDGQKAVVTETVLDEALFAKVPNPVPPDALIEVEAQDDSGMIIINAFPVSESGDVPPDAQQAVKIILGQQGESSVRLNATMDNQPLAPGRYGLNIVSAGETSRVMIVVE